VFITVKELELQDLGFSVALKPGEIEFFDRLRQRGELVAEGKAELSSDTLDEIRVRGHLHVPMESDCDRCLEPAAFEVDGEFDFVYRPARFAKPSREEVELVAGESEIAFYDDGGLELNDVLREYVLLSVPMRKLCRPDCKGICPVCGRNCNASACGCREKPADDRWAALKRI
jgi:uncharacterized protein